MATGLTRAAAGSGRQRAGPGLLRQYSYQCFRWAVFRAGWGQGVSVFGSFFALVAFQGFSDRCTTCWHCCVSAEPLPENRPGGEIEVKGVHYPIKVYEVKTTA